MAAALSGFAIDVESGSWKHPLPGPLTAAVGVLASQRPWKLHPARPLPEISVVLFLDEFKMPSQIAPDDGRKRRGPVLVALAGAHHELMTLEIDVLHPESRAFEQTQP